MVKNSELSSEELLIIEVLNHVSRVHYKGSPVSETVTMLRQGIRRFIPLPNHGLIFINDKLVPPRILIKPLGKGKLLDFRIESGIPLAKHGGGGRSNNPFPFDKMKLGDSFYVADIELYNKACYHGRYYGKSTKNKKFAVRKEGDGFRVYRTQ